MKLSIRTLDFAESLNIRLGAVLVGVHALLAASSVAERIDHAQWWWWPLIALSALGHALIIRSVWRAS